MSSRAQSPARLAPPCLSRGNGTSDCMVENVGLFLRAPGWQLSFISWNWSWAGLVAVLPKAGLQRAADLLFEAGMQDSWILQESAFSSHFS